MSSVANRQAARGKFAIAGIVKQYRRYRRARAPRCEIAHTSCLRQKRLGVKGQSFEGTALQQSILVSVIRAAVQSNSTTVTFVRVSLESVDRCWIPDRHGKAARLGGLCVQILDFCRVHDVVGREASAGRGFQHCRNLIQKRA